MTEHAWAEVRFNYGTWLECECGYRPNSQEEMDAHIAPPNLTVRVAAAMYNAPDPDEPAAKNLTWPPSHPEDLAWWMTRAEAAINAIKES